MRRWLLITIVLELVVSMTVLVGHSQQSHHRYVVEATGLQYTPAVPLVATTTSTSTTTTLPTTTTTVKKAPPPKPTVLIRAPDVQAIGDVQAVIVRAFAEVGANEATQQRAIRVARCESSLSPTARSGSHVGLFQLATKYHQPRAAALGFTWQQVSTEAWPNARTAASLWADDGWAPWTCKG